MLLMTLVLNAHFNLTQCLTDATDQCVEAVQVAGTSEHGTGVLSDWLRDCQRGAVQLCLAKADRHTHFGDSRRP